jgi:hypothetical protein
MECPIDGNVVRWDGIVRELLHYSTNGQGIYAIDMDIGRESKRMRRSKA